MTKHGHGLPRKRPGRPAKDEIDETDLGDEVLPLEELPELTAFDDEDQGGSPGGVTATAGPAAEPGFDCELRLDVPEMEKSAVAAAVADPLQRAVAAAPTRWRHRRVLVRFGGQALIGSAVKELVAGALRPHKPLAVVVRRGFGDEQVLAGQLPRVDFGTTEAGGVITAAVGTGDLEAEDLPLALAEHLRALAATVRDRAVVLQFSGAARPDAAMRESICAQLRAGGAVRVSIGARVLFDRELEQQVRCTSSGDWTHIEIAMTGEDAATVDALALVLPPHADALRGRQVRFRFARDSDAVANFCTDHARGAGAVRIEVERAAMTDVVWPPLLTVEPGAEVNLRIDANGRSRAALFAALERECRALHAVTQGKSVVVDWPAGALLDADGERALGAVLPHLAPRRLACTIGGEQREPFVPEPVQMMRAGDRFVLRLDSEAGKPAELQRAIDRRLPGLLAGLRGAAIRVQVAGGVALPRKLLRSLCDRLEAAGAMRLEVEIDGEVDVLLPPLLAAAPSPAGVRITAVVDDHDEDQQDRALRRELEAMELPAGAVVTVSAGPLAPALAAAVAARGAARVLLDGSPPVQVHPPLFRSAGKQGREARLVVAPPEDRAQVALMLDRELPDRLAALGVLAQATVTIVWPGAGPSDPDLGRLVAALLAKAPSRILLDDGRTTGQVLHPRPVVAAPPPAAAPAAVPAPPVAPAAARRPLLKLLGVRDEAVPPIALIGVEAGDDPAHVEAVAAALAPQLPRLRGRAVLFVPRAGDVDVPARRRGALVDLLARVGTQGPSATLVFRGPDANGRPHFQVLQSALRALPVGGVFADPRARRIAAAPPADSP